MKLANEQIIKIVTSLPRFKHTGDDHFDIEFWDEDAEFPLTIPARSTINQVMAIVFEYAYDAGAGAGEIRMKENFRILLS